MSYLPEFQPQELYTSFKNYKDNQNQAQNSDANQELIDKKQNDNIEQTLNIREEMTNDQTIEQFEDKKKQSQLIQQSELHSFEINKDYFIPKWSGKPIYNYFLEVIKEGVIIDTIDISQKPFYLIGKYQDLSDIVCQHDSISRKHAILQFKQNGEGIFLFDLGSQNGTRVNKMFIKKKQYLKLNPNDVIRFGESSRLFVLKCPYLEELKESGQITQETQDSILEKAKDDATLIKLYQEQQLKQKENKILQDKQQLKQVYEDLLYKQKMRGSKKQIQQEKQIDGIDWGIQDDQFLSESINSEEIALDPNLLKQIPNLNFKQIEKINNFEQKYFQFAQLEKEYNELITKQQEQYGLSVSDQNRITNLKKKMETEEKQLTILEDSLRQNLFGETQTKQEKIILLRNDDTFQGDEYFDRAKQHNYKFDYQSQVKKVKTEDVLKKNEIQSNEVEINNQEFFDNPHLLQENLQSLKRQKEEIEQKIENTKQNINQTLKKVDQLDSLDEFMSKNEQQLINDNLESLKFQLLRIQKEISSKEILLEFLIPNKQQYELSGEKQNNLINFKIPQKKKIQKTLDKIKTEFESEQNDISYLDQDLQRDLIQHQKNYMNDGNELNDFEENYTSNYRNQEKNQTNKEQSSKNNIISKSQQCLEDEIDENFKWIPPSNQTGDGKTELNFQYGY